MILETEIKQPYVGLRPFSQEDSMLFFGREEQTIQLLEKLYNHRFLAVIGSSGSGKSSLIKAGLIPSLEGGFLVEDRDIWEVLQLRPREKPLQHLADELAQFIGMNPEEFIEDARNKGIHEIVNLVTTKIDEYTNLLILVDQFEELFTYVSSGKENYNSIEKTIPRDEDRTIFVNLLIELAYRSSSNIYVVVTMRSEYLGHCSRYTGLPEVFNSGQYLVPRLSRRQRKKAIEGPIGLMGKSISPVLLDHLLNLVGDDRDQLSLVQHLMSRIWKLAQDDATITFKHYNDAGGYVKQDENIDFTSDDDDDEKNVNEEFWIKGALSKHGESIYQKLSSNQKRITRLIFRRLVNVYGKEGGVKLIASVEELSGVTEATFREVCDVIEYFRADRVSFLYASDQILTPETTVDIVHESLFRNWRRLIKWLKQQRRDADDFLRYADSAERKDKSGLLGTAETKQASKWRKREGVNERWAESFGKDYSETLDYIEKSERKRRMLIGLYFAIPVVISIFVFSGMYLQLETAKIKKARDLEAVERMRADSATILANKKTEEAEKASANAIIEAENALREKNIADSLRNVAVKSIALLELALDSANRSRELAESSMERARLAQERAVAEANRANNLLLETRRINNISNGLTFAIKSQQLGTPAQKGILALEAYRLLEENGADLFDNELYRALYFSLESLTPNFNVTQVHAGKVTKLIATSENNVISASNDGSVKEFSISKQNVEKSLFESSQSYPLDITAYNNQLAISLSDGIFTFLLLNNLQSKRDMYSPNGSMWSISFLPDNSGLVMTGEGKKVLLSDFRNTQEIAAFAVKPLVIEPSVDARKVFVGTDNSAHIIDLTQRNYPTIELIADKSDSIDKGFTAISNSPSGQYVAFGRENGNILILDLYDKSTQILEGHNSTITALQYSPDQNYLVSASRDRSLRMWDLQDLFKYPVTIDNYSGWVTAATFDQSGDHVISGTQNGVLKVLPTSTIAMLTPICRELCDRNVFANTDYKQFYGKNVELGQLKTICRCQ